MSRLLPLRSLPQRALDFLTARSTAFGNRHGLDWLTYSPLQMLAYHRIASRDAPAVMGSIAEVFGNATRVADVGSGSGAFAAEAVRLGLRTVACERSLGGRLLGKVQHVPVTPFDLDASPPALLPGELDLAYCFEVAEHCAPAQGDRLVDFLAGLAPTIVFTAAHPGQGGLSHVNEQPQEYWISRFAEAGAAYQLELVEQLRAAFERRGVVAPWFGDNLMIFTVLRPDTSG